MVRQNLVARSLGTMTRLQDGKTAQAVASGKIILESLLKPKWNRKSVKTPVTPKAIQDAFDMIAGNQMRRKMEAERAEKKRVGEERPPETDDPQRKPN